MEAERVRAVRGPRREHAEQSVPRDAARIDFEHVAAPLVEPGDHDELVAAFHAPEALRGPRPDLQPRIGGALIALAGSALPLLERASDDPDGPEPEPVGRGRLSRAAHREFTFNIPRACASPQPRSGVRPGGPTRWCACC